MITCYCPNCRRRSGFKRSLGWGTFFMVVLTCGFWLLLIPFYPMRCIGCGITQGEALRLEYARDARPIGSIELLPRGSTASKAAYVVCFAIIAGLLLYALRSFTGGTQQTSSAPIVDGPERHSSVQDKPQPSATTAPNNAHEHSLDLAPNLFGPGASADGRTYSISLVSAYRNKIPPTHLFVQGVILGQIDAAAIALADEENPNDVMACSMSPEEFGDVAYLYHKGDRVQAVGEFFSGSDGAMVLRDCRVADPTDNVVRPAPSEPASAAPGEQEGSEDRSPHP